MSPIDNPLLAGELMNESKLLGPNHDQPFPHQKNPLARGSLILAIVALVVCLGGLALNQWIEFNKIPDKPFQPGDVTLITDKLENGVSFGKQFIVFIISHAASLTLALTALIVGFIAMSRPNNKPAKAGIALSLLAILLLVF